MLAVTDARCVSYTDNFIYIYRAELKLMQRAVEGERGLGEYGRP
jgi:hypothetical protein